MSRLLPHPLLAAGLVLVWLLLNGFTPGQFLLGLAVALFAGWAMAALEPKRLNVRSWPALFRLVGVVFVDIVRSNIGVVRAILWGAGRRSGFVAVPLDISDRNALATLALIVNNTPGTAWLEYDSGSGVMLLHVFDHKTDAEWVDIIKNRYEVLLKEIFQ